MPFRIPPIYAHRLKSFEVLEFLVYLKAGNLNTPK